MPSLFVIRGNDQGSRYELTDPTVRLGRDASNQIEIHDTEVSRRHAELRREDGEYRVVDLDSSNGTYVNGRRLTTSLLGSGDQLQLGGTLLLYTGKGSEESAEELSQAVDIAGEHPAADRSRIVRAISQEDGSRVFQLDGSEEANPWLARARSNLQVMYRTALAVSHTLDIDRLLRRIMDLIFEWVEADRGCIMLVDRPGGALQPKVRRTRTSPGTKEKITISKTILDYVMEKNQGVLTSDAKEDVRWDSTASILQAGVREAICVPMQGRYDVVGVIYIDTSTSPKDFLRDRASKFNEDHLKLMIAIAHQAALAVEDTRYYSAMVQAERLAAIGQTIATLSHHIKNILQGIRGGSYLIEMGLSENDPSITRRGWKIVDKNQGKISNLVMDMLTFSKEREPDLAPASLNETVGDVVELMLSRAAEMGVKLHWQPDERIPTLVFDAEAIHRAVLNVVTNAIDAAVENEEEGEVRVATRFDEEGEQISVTVEDSGPGIPQDQREDLFSPFVSSKKGRGTGLGLPVSQKIIAEHGGNIEVTNLDEGGARFSLDLPAVYPETDGTTRLK